MLDIDQPRTRDRISGSARLVGVVLKVEKRSDCIHFKAQIAGMTDKQKSLDIAVIVKAAVAFGARRNRKKPDLLVITDRWHFYAAGFRSLANRNIGVHFFSCSSSH
ncbi:hypothetical protein D9M70_511290 [compost metagenome]